MNKSIILKALVNRLDEHFETLGELYSSDWDDIKLEFAILG